jgi:hypothetical protein
MAERIVTAEMRGFAAAISAVRAEPAAAGVPPPRWNRGSTGHS